MPIPEDQLETWSHQGSITQSSTTYNTVKQVLESTNTLYNGKSYKVFLQGSYGNDTNIYSESDVDIVARLDSCFLHDLTELPQSQQDTFKLSHSDAIYTHKDFKNDVLKVLTEHYGDAIKSGEKAIAINASGNRRKTDVIAAIQFRRFHKFISTSDQSYDEGICFYTSTGERIANYPKQHSENLTRKHKDTSQWLKPMARILKNLRSKLVEEELLDDGIAPSYYLEGLLYNVPSDQFGTSYVDSFVNVINWLNDADKAKFVCANEQYYLLWKDSPVTWREEKCEAFLKAACDLWRQW
jgi:hypothetical protein